jgi:hypothetical protein
MGADWIIVGVGIAAGLLLLAAWLSSKLKKKYKLVSPIKKVTLRKRRAKTKPTKKKRKSLVIRIG